MPKLYIAIFLNLVYQKIFDSSLKTLIFGGCMPLCGWNDDMSKGLMEFVTGSEAQACAGGLTLQTLKRAQDENVPVSAIPKIEIEEIDALLSELHLSPHRQKLAGVIAVGSLIRYFYVELGEELIKDPTQTVQAVFGAKVEELNKLLFAMEANYYEELRPRHSRLEAIRLIRGFLECEVV